MLNIRDTKIIVLTIFCVAPWVCFGLKCKFNEKVPGVRPEIVKCQTDEHYCAAANCTAYNSFTEPRSYHFTSWGCFNSTDSQKCSELFTAKSFYGRNYTCEPCFIGKKDVDLANENFTKVLRCKRGEEGGPLDFTEIVECYEGAHFCVAASCIYLNSGFGPQPKVTKATNNVTKWDCAEHNDSRYGMSAYIPDIDMLCDEPRFIGEKDVDLANINYTGVFPTAAEYKLTGRKPPPPTTTEKEPLPPTTTKATGKGIESVFTNLLLVMLTFVLAILCCF